MRITQPCRDTLQSLGTPSDRLLIAHRFKNMVKGGPFRSGLGFAGIGERTMEHFGLLADDGSPLSVSLRRLRLSRTGPQPACPPEQRLGQ